MLEIVETQGSFVVDKLEVFEIAWDDSVNELEWDKYQSGESIAKTIRAILEPMLSPHFGDDITDKLFTRFAINVADHVALEKLKNLNIAVSLTKKELAT